MKILFSGGGTLGSVTPLIAIAQEIKKRQPGAEFLWLGTRTGPEDAMVARYGIAFKKIFSGKFRRYLSWKNFVDPLFVVIGFFQALMVISKFKPGMVMTAGGYVAVPVVWAAWLLRRPVIIHQEDIRPSVTNKLTAWFASTITVTFEKSLADFPKGKTVWTGNPVRDEIFSGNTDNARVRFLLESTIPTVLVVGGSTGAQALNNVIVTALPILLEHCQVIHVTGGKEVAAFSHPRYHRYDFLADELKDAYAVSDVVISRGGMSTLAELATLRKAVVIAPIPGTHQVDNANEFFKNNAALVINEKDMTPEQCASIILEAVNDLAVRQNLSRNIGKLLPDGAVEKIVSMIV